VPFFVVDCKGLLGSALLLVGETPALHSEHNGLIDALQTRTRFWGGRHLADKLPLVRWRKLLETNPSRSVCVKSLLKIGWYAQRLSLYRLVPVAAIFSLANLCKSSCSH